MTDSINKKVDEMLSALALEIQDLIKIKSTLSLGARSGVREEAERTLSREINKRVDSLSIAIQQRFIQPALEEEE